MHGTGVGGQEELELRHHGQGLTHVEAAGQIVRRPGKTRGEALREVAIRGRAGDQHLRLVLTLQPGRQLAPAVERPLLDPPPTARVQADQGAAILKPGLAQEALREGAVGGSQGIEGGGASERFGRSTTHCHRHRPPVLLDPGHRLVQGHDVGEQVVTARVRVADAPRSSAHPQQKRRPKIALQVERDVEVVAAEGASLAGQGTQALRSLRWPSHPGSAPHEHLVHGEAARDALAPASHHEPDACVRSRGPEVVQRGQAHQHVADAVEAKHQDLAPGRRWRRRRGAAREPDGATQGLPHLAESEGGACGCVQGQDEGAFPRLVDPIRYAPNGRPALPLRHRPLRRRARRPSR